MSAKSYANLYKFKYCRNMCNTNLEKCTYGSSCKDTKLTTQDNAGTVQLISNTINLDASNNVKINDLIFSGNTIESENDIILMADTLDMSINNLNIYAKQEIDISANDISINSTNTLDIDSNNVNIQSANLDMSTNSLDISVNKVNVTISGIKFEFIKETDGSNIININTGLKNYKIDGSTNETCSIM